jgi:tRNA-dihydrouridine synthase B
VNTGNANSFFKGLPNFKEHRMKMVSSEDPEFIFESFAEVLKIYDGLELV